MEHFTVSPEQLSPLQQKYGMNEEEWELLCNGCGICCFNKATVNGRMKVLDSACPYLNPYNRRCTIYNKRFKVNPKCLKLAPDNMIALWLLGNAEKEKGNQQQALAYWNRLYPLLASDGDKQRIGQLIQSVGGSVSDAVSRLLRERPWPWQWRDHSLGRHRPGQRGCHHRRESWGARVGRG